MGAGEGREEVDMMEEGGGRLYPGRKEDDLTLLGGGEDCASASLA